MSERASFDELLEFANKVRAAGGGNPLDALMPAVPEDISQCLIAKNLNFNCAVNGGSGGGWVMHLEDEATARKIADELGLPYRTDVYESYEDENGYEVQLRHGVELPEAIGNVATDFDMSLNIASEISHYGPGSVDADEIQLLRDMAPYIEASEVEARELASIVHPDGSITI